MIIYVETATPLVLLLQPEGSYDLISLPRPATLVRKRLSNLWTCHIPNSKSDVDNLCTLITAKSSLYMSLPHTAHHHPQSLKYLCSYITEHHHRLCIEVIGYVMSSSSSSHHHHQHVMCM